MYLYAKASYEAKYKFLIDKQESTCLQHLNVSKAFIKYWNDMGGIYKTIEEYNPNKKRKLLTVFDDIVADMLSNEKLNTIVTEFFIRGRKLNIPLAFITLSYFAVPKNIRLNSTHYFIMKILNKREFQQIAFNHLSDIDFKDFMNLYKKYFAKLYIF